MNNADFAIAGAGLVGCLLADKGYKSNAFLEKVADTGAQAVIPPCGNRKKQRDYDRYL